MDEKIPERVKQERFEAVMDQQRRISEGIQETFIGKTLKVLIDEKDVEDKNLYYGRSEGHAPEVDGQVIVHSKKALRAGDFVDVRITEGLEYDLVGQAE